jgi:hypothetical protein
VSDASAPVLPRPARAQEFAYAGFDIDTSRGELVAHYSLDGQGFAECITIAGVEPDAWERPGVEAAAAWVVLLLGVSYYKAGAPAVVDLGALPVSAEDREFLGSYYLDGLGEYAYRNGLDLSGLEFRGGDPVAGSGAPPVAPTALRPLVPFGGGIDSIVTTELVRSVAGDDNTALFIVSKSGDRYAAIETPALLTGLPVLRAERQLDERILRSSELGYLNGHVPVTGMISAIAVLAALLHGRDAVVMSNESSASSGNVRVGERDVNHQWSKSMAFEAGFRGVLTRQHVPVDYFSLLRSASELWVARRFAALTGYHRAFRSCNRAFYVDPALRLDHWCGECDKCCFVDLVLAPFMGRAELSAVFGGLEPLAEASLAERFRTLLGTSSSPKPFDCVGDISECRTALRLTAARPDRAGDALVQRLLAELPSEPDAVESLLRPSGPHFIPDTYAPGALLV